MNKIKFDLVPSRKNVTFYTSTYQIPNKNGSWMDTDPFGFSSELTEANKRYGYLVKPMARMDILLELLNWKK